MKVLIPKLFNCSLSDSIQIKLVFIYSKISIFFRQKSSFLPSYIIDVRELDEKLLNIIDMKFLHGYYEPTLLILFEPNQTWPGYDSSDYQHFITYAFSLKHHTLCCLC